MSSRIPRVRIKGYRYVPYSRTVGVTYAREILGGRIHHDLTFSLWARCLYVEVTKCRT